MVKIKCIGGYVNEKILNRVLTLLLAFALSFNAEMITLADEIDEKCSDESAHENEVPYFADMKSQYYMENDNVIEVVEYTDTDNVYTTIKRTIFPDGTGNIILEKNGKEEVYKLTDLDYELFYLWANRTSSMSRGSTVGKDLTGSQYKHVKISSTKQTFNKTTLAKYAAKSSAAIAVQLVSEMGGIPTTVAALLAAEMLDIILDESPDRMIISQTMYEVLFSYDSVYYTHCYHEIMKSYNKVNGEYKLIDTTKMYKQAVGG